MYHEHAIERILLSEETINTRVLELAAQISHDYKESENIYLVGILKGAFIFLADLSRALQIPHTVDFMAVSSYGSSTISSGAVRLILDLRQPIEGKHVIIVEDIVDSAHTLKYLYKTLSGRNPASIKTCVLLKKKREGNDFPIDYLGFTIPDVWVVGYGLDFADQYRTLPFVAELKKKIYKR